MKKIFAVITIAVSVAASAQDHYVNGYYRRDGTYVQGHHRTNPNYSQYDNYSTRGNINPYTGQEGTHTPYPSYGGYNSRHSNTYGGYGRNRNPYGGRW